MENEIAQAAGDIGPTFLQSLALFMDEGGIFMWVIAVVWAFGIAIALERAKALFSFDVDSHSLMGLVKKHVLSNEVQKAIQSCSNSKAILPYVLRSGLKRANQTKEQIEDAVQVSMLEMMPKIERRMGYLSLTANISTLLGLLGTIQALILSFASVANADPANKAKLLAESISVAMNTTALGLISAISIMVIHSFLASKAEKITTEIEENAMKLVDLLGTKKGHRELPPEITEAA